MSEIDDLLAGYKPEEAEHPVLFDHTIGGKIRKLKQRIVKVAASEKWEGLDSPTAQLEQELAGLEAEREKAIRVFRLRAIPNEQLQELIRTSPPSPAQVAEYKKLVSVNPFAQPDQINPDVYAPKLIAATVFDPAMDEADARKLWARLSDGEAAALFAACQAVNQEVGARPTFGNGTDRTGSSVPESTTPPNVESL